MTSTAAPGSGPARLRGWLGHLGASVVVVLAGALPNGPGMEMKTWSVGVVVLNLLAAAVLLARRRQPDLVLGVVVALVVASVPLGLFNGGMVVAAGIAVYALTLRGVPVLRGVVVTLAVAALVLAAALVAGEGFAPQPVLVVLLGGAIGHAIHAQRQHVAEILGRAQRAERTREALARQRVAEDRLAIARDLHDVVAHQIAVINLHAGVASSALRTRPEDAAASLTIVRDSARTVLSEIGDLMTALRDPDPAKTPLPGLAQLDDLVRDVASHGLDVTRRTVGTPRELPAAVDVTAFRVAQEALANAHKHGGEHRAHVLVEYRIEALRITVTNPLPGNGDRAAKTPGEETAPAVGTSNGLVGMRERVDSVRGSLVYGRDGTGRWIVAADLPTPPVPGSSKDRP